MQRCGRQPVSPFVPHASGAAAWGLLLLALTLGVLNPVACLIHCLPHAHTAHTESTPFAFFCRIPDHLQTSAPDASSAPSASTNPAAAPQAVYAFVLVDLVLLPFLVIERGRVSFRRIRLDQRFEQPLIPPPQAV